MSVGRDVWARVKEILEQEGLEETPHGIATLINWHVGEDRYTGEYIEKVWEGSVEYCPRYFYDVCNAFVLTEEHKAQVFANIMHIGKRNLGRHDEFYSVQVELLVRDSYSVV